MTEDKLASELALLKEVEDAIDHWSLIVEDPTRPPGEQRDAAAHLRYNRQLASGIRSRIAELRRQQGGNQ